MHARQFLAQANLTQLNSLAQEIVAHARRDYPAIDTSEIAALLKLEPAAGGDSVNASPGEQMLFSKAA